MTERSAIDRVAQDKALLRLAKIRDIFRAAELRCDPVNHSGGGCNYCVPIALSFRALTVEEMEEVAKILREQ